MISRNLREGESNLLKGKGDDFVSLEMVNNPEIDINQWISRIKKPKKNRRKLFGLSKLILLIIHSHNQLTLLKTIIWTSVEHTCS